MAKAALPSSSEKATLGNPGPPEGLLPRGSRDSSAIVALGSEDSEELFSDWTKSIVAMPPGVGVSDFWSIVAPTQTAADAAR
ncbi:MAG TPA: hypothetical protein VKE98_06970 [Gemmataceae bacterium]|nr:hypothetical protein [Gemmataceae bacterium]